MLNPFVIVPAAAVFALLGGVHALRQSARAGRWRAVLAGGLASLRPEDVEEVVRHGMAEASGEEPRHLTLTAAGRGRLTGTAEVSGKPVGLVVEVRVEGNGLRVAWDQTPVEQ